MARTVVGIHLCLWSTGILVPFVSWDPRLGLTVGVFMSVFTGAGSDWHSLLTSDTDRHVMSIITEFTVVFDMTGSVVRIDYRIGPTLIFVPFVARRSLFNQSISVLVPVLSRSWCFGDLLFTSNANSLIWQVITKLFRTGIRTRSVFRVNFRIWPTLIFVPLIARCSRLGLPVSLFVLVLPRPRDPLNLLFTPHSDRKLIKPGSKTHLSIISPRSSTLIRFIRVWVSTSDRPLRCFIPNGIFVR